MTWSRAPCTIRSLRVGTPKGRFSLLPALGIQTRLTACGWYLIGSQFLFQLCYCLVFVYFNLSRALLIDSRASAFGYYLLQRSTKVLWTPYFIYQPKPLSSFNPRFQGCQHAFRPDDRFHPCPSGTDLSILWSPLRHCRRCSFRSSVFHASTFLLPLLHGHYPASSLLRRLCHLSGTVLRTARR